MTVNRSIPGRILTAVAALVAAFAASAQSPQRAMTATVQRQMHYLLFLPKSYEAT